MSYYLKKKREREAFIKLVERNWEINLCVGSKKTAQPKKIYPGTEVKRKKPREKTKKQKQKNA